MLLSLLMNAKRIATDIRKCLNSLQKDGITYSTMSDESGVNRATLHKIACGKITNPRLETVAALVNYLGVEVRS